jgi:hypothetical protein
LSKHIGKFDKWSPEEDFILMENAYLGPYELMKLLNRSYAGVTQRAHKLRLSLTPIPKRLKPLKQRRIKKKVEQQQLGPFSSEMLQAKPITSLYSSLWQHRRLIILKMHDYCCAYCGSPANTVDHIIPRSKGGTDHLENLVAACSRCNYSKSDDIWLVRFISA